MEIRNEDKTMTEEFRQRLIDYFDAEELVDFLRIPVTDIVTMFEVEIEEAEEDLEEFMQVGTRNGL